MRVESAGKIYQNGMPYRVYKPPGGWYLYECSSKTAYVTLNELRSNCVPFSYVVSSRLFFEFSPICQVD